MENRNTNNEVWGGEIGSPNKESGAITKEVAIQQINRLVTRAKKAPFIVDATLPMDKATSTRTGEIMMERRSQINRVVERTEKFRNYLENTEEIERERSRLKDEADRAAGEMNSFAGDSGEDRSKKGMEKHREIVHSIGEQLKEFEKKNIPYEVLHEEDLVAAKDINNNEFGKDYSRNIRSWIGVAKKAQTEALEKIKEDNLPPELKEARTEIARLRDELETAKQLLSQEHNERKRAEEIAGRIQEEQLATPQSTSPAESFTLAGKMVREPENMTAAELNQLIEGKFMSKTDLTDDQRRKMIAERFIEEYDLPSDYQNFPRPTEAPENLRRNEGFGSRIRQNLDYILGGVTGFVTTEAAAGAALWAFPQLGPIGVELASVAATLGWTGLWISSEYRRFRERLPRVTRFLRGSVIGSLAGTTINTATSALESAGIINIMPGWPNGEEQIVPQVLEKITAAVPPTTEVSVKGGQNLSTIVKDALHLTKSQDIYRHTVDTILGNLDKFPADKTKLVSGLTTDQVMHDSKLFRLVMDVGRIIRPGQVFTIR